MNYNEQPDGSYAPDPGYEALWNWFGLSRDSWVTMPRAMMHHMPDEWQAKMAELLNEWSVAWANAPDEVSVGTRVSAHRGGRFVKMPEILCNYRHPDSETIRSWMAPP